MKLQSKHIFAKSILIALLFSLFIWLAESVAHMFYFSETFEHLLNHEPLGFMDAFIYQVPKYSLFIRLTCITATVLMGGVIGLLLERDYRRTTALLDRERDYHEAINAVNEGIFTYFVNSEKINASSLCFSMLGYAPQKQGVSLESFYQLIPPKDRKQINHFLKKRIEKNKSFSFELEIKTKSGKWNWILLKGSVQESNKDGSAKRIVGIVVDISQQMEAQSRLSNSEKRYRTLFENIYQGIIIIDKKNQSIKLTNKVFCELLGYTQKEILSCSLKNLHPDKNFPYDSAWTKVKGKAFSGKVDCLRKDGSVLPAEVYASSIILEGRECIIAIFRDLTETYQVEYDRYMLKTAVDNSDVEIAINNPDGSIDYCSPALCRRLGYSSEEMKKLYIWDIESTIKKEEMDMIFQNLRKVKTKKGEGIQVGKDGTKFEINYVVDLLVIGNKELVCCNVQDVTESNKRETILERAKQKAEESDRLKSVFLANISHEIRTPMNGILGFADLLLRNDLSLEKCQQYAKIISDCGNNLMQLLNDILDISRIEAGEIEIKKDNFCINEVIEELYNFYEPQTKRDDKDITLQMHKSLRNDEAVIYSDRRYLGQIMTNLLSNALKFTNKGEILIGYNAKQSSIEFFVKDSGEGIAPELLEEIFEPFRQGEEILSRKHHGTGLGLAIAKSYTELLGGYMRVESEVDHGTTFYLTLPYSANIKIQASTSTASTQTDYPWEDKTFLIVEDNYISFMLLKNLLEDSGVKIFHAETAQQSIDMTKSINHLDLILMDVRLPDFTGWEAAKIIKKDNPDLPIIAQTANANASDKIKTFQAGCEAYLTKPIIKKEFYETIKKCLEK